MDEDAYLVDDQHAYNDVNYPDYEGNLTDIECCMLWEECPLPEDYAKRNCVCYSQCKADYDDAQ